MLQLTDGDKEFIKLTETGVRPSPAFREAYPEHDAVVFWKMTDPGTPERQKAAEVLKQAAKNKLNTKHITRALSTYQDKMEEYSALSLETATDLVKNARSEKVRADLAIEGIRHKIGSPTVKVAVQEKKVVILQFGAPPDGSHLPPTEIARTFVEGEILDAVLDPDDHPTSEDE